MNNNLTARVVIKATQAKRSLSELIRSVNKFESAINRVKGQSSKLEFQLRKVGTTGVKAGNDTAKSFRNARHELTELSNGLTKVLGLYTAISGMGTMITTSDSMTSAQNKLNYLNSELLGEGGLTTDASGKSTYSDATLQATQSQLDKMYNSANKVRTSYTDMMSNVSKSMTLAPDAFAGNVDNAIRFQEIMAEAYTLGGASQQEMHSSMYQMIQALGSGILAGDELRSVREGAPLAYKEIEKFAQGLYNTTDSLKDMASQGMITSDIVVAAMTQAGDSIDKAFAMTDMTYAQAWTLIKNSTTKAFEPVFKKLNEFLNSDKGRAAIEAVISVMEDLANVMLTIVVISTNVIGWMAENWSWLKYIIYGAVAGLIAFSSALIAFKAFSFIVSIIGILGGQLSAIIALVIAIGAIVAAVLNALLGASITFADSVAKLFMWLGATILTIIAVLVVAAWLGLISVTFGWYLLVLAIIGLLLLLVGVFIKWADKILGVFFGVIYAMEAILQNLKAAWRNLLIGMQKSFWLWIDDIMKNFGLILDIVNAIRESFGKKPLDVNFAVDKANSLNGEFQTYTNIGDAYRNGYAVGSEMGKGIQDKINGWGDKLKNPADDMKKALELTEVGSGLNNGALGDISDDTSRIADSMELTNEDLEYLRRIAAMEWKKEYTTANITVDMKNYNQVNGENDLDGIVKQLSNKLYEELGEVANGVYA